MFKLKIKKPESKATVPLYDEAKVRLLDDTHDVEDDDCDSVEPSKVYHQEETETMSETKTEPSFDDKEQLISQVLELHKTLSELYKKATGIREKNKTLKSENQILSEYIKNVMTASCVFQPVEK